MPCDFAKEDHLSKNIEAMKIDVPADDEIIDMEASDEPSTSKKDTQNDASDRVFFGKPPSEGKTLFNTHDSFSLQLHFSFSVLLEKES